MVYRDLSGNIIQCGDFICKVGKGTGDRVECYRTPYSTDKLKMDTWTCPCTKTALDIEKAILNILDMRGWLKYHVTKKRSEVISFPFTRTTHSQMIDEYMTNMKWIHKLISYYHKLITDGKGDDMMKLIDSLKKKIVKESMSDKHLHIFGTVDNMERILRHMFQFPIKVKKNNNEYNIIFNTSSSMCNIL